MSEDQCRKADWLERGQRDGRNGENENYVAQHREACAKAGVVPDDRRWRQGWAEGVRSYCTPRVAWQRGVDNNSYRGACRDFDEATFMTWYRAGQDVYKTRSERDARQREIEKAEKDLEKAAKEEDRKALRDKIRSLDQEQARLRRLLDAQMSRGPR